MSLHLGNYEIGEIYFSNANREVFPIGTIHLNGNELFNNNVEPLPSIDNPTDVNSYVKEENKIQTVDIVTSKSQTYISLFTFRSDVATNDSVGLKSLRLWVSNPNFNEWNIGNYTWKNLFILKFYDKNGNPLTEETIQDIDYSKMVVVGIPTSNNSVPSEERADVMGDNMNIGSVKVGDDNFYCFKFLFSDVELVKGQIYGLLIRDSYNWVGEDGNTYLFINPNVVCQTALEKSFDGTDINSISQGSAIRILPSWYYDENGDIYSWVTEEQLASFNGKFILNKPLIRALFEYEEGYEWCYPNCRLINDVVFNNTTT